MSAQSSIITRRSNNEDESKSQLLVSFKAVPSGPRCPFGNSSVDFEVYHGGCVWVGGNSGLGKTTISTYLAGLSTEKELSKLDIRSEVCNWDASIPASERCGVLFQQTTLLDALTIAGNVCVALEACPHHVSACESNKERDQKIKRLIEAVGLDYARDGPKRPTELSGGMGRRASLALQLAQRKRLIVLDEPFTGLDRDAAASVAKELVHLRVDHGTAFILISHEPDMAALVMDKTRTAHNVTVKLTPPNLKQSGYDEQYSRALSTPNLFGITAWQRFLEKLADYILWSLPLIALTFVACGLAIAMLSSDILHRIDVNEQVIDIVDREVKPLLKMLTGEEDNKMALMMVKIKVRGMLNTVIPEAKANLYAIGMAKLFVLEIGPLLTALLLCGRIGGSYAGKVATMQATAQNKLLRTLGINPQHWTLFPAMAAALLASPFLTVIGTLIAVVLGGVVGPRYGIGTVETYTREVRAAVFPTLRLRSFVEPPVRGEVMDAKSLFDFVRTLDLRSTYSDSYTDALVEIITYPPFFLLLKSTTFIFVVLMVAEVAAR